MKMSDGKSRPPVPLQNVSGGELLVCAGWLGLLSGMLEGLAHLALQHWEILEWDVALISVGPQQVFVSAAVNAILFLALALFLSLIGSHVTWRYWPSVTLGLFLFLSFLALVDLSGRIQLRASLLLALGLTVQAVHWIGPQRDKVLAFMRGSLLPLAGATAVAGLVAWPGGPIAERVQASRLPSSTGAPSVLLIVLDTLRADHLSGYGYDRPTSPNLDAFAAQGIRFEHAYVSSSWTLPTHATLMTGLLPRHHLLDHGNSLYEEVIHVPLILRLPAGAHAGRLVAPRVSLRDVPATVLSLAGAKGHRLGGRSLVEFWEGPSTPPRPLIAEVDGAPFPGLPQDWPVRNGRLKSITLEQWELILHEDGSAELFDLEADPLERNNLALQPVHRARVERMRQLLLASLRQNAQSSESD